MTSAEEGRRISRLDFRLHEAWPVLLIVAGVALILDSRLAIRSGGDGGYDPHRPIEPGARS